MIKGNDNIKLDFQNKKPEIKSFHLIKAVCALGIIAYHFSCHLEYRNNFNFCSFLNGDWGCVLVTVFFMVSGGLLYYNYCHKISLVDYFKKRWKSIFPMFYIGYFSFELGNIFANNALSFRGDVVPYVFTLLGMDGYFSGVTTTYYIIGEWFLGAIILLYILFPLILYFFKKSSVMVLVLSLVFYFVFLGKPIINPQPFWSITSCLISFVVGMTIVKYREILTNNIIALATLFFLIIMFIIKIPISQDISNHVVGFLLFVILFFIGNKIMNNSVCEKIFTKLSKLSYAIFLLQHITIIKVLGVSNPESTLKLWVLLIGTVILTVIQAEMLNITTKHFVCQIEKAIFKIFSSRKQEVIKGK